MKTSLKWKKKTFLDFGGLLNAIFEKNNYKWQPDTVVNGIGFSPYKIASFSSVKLLY